MSGKDVMVGLNKILKRKTNETKERGKREAGKKREKKTMIYIYYTIKGGMAITLHTRLSGQEFHAENRMAWMDILHNCQQSLLVQVPNGNVSTNTSCRHYGWPVRAESN